MIGITSTIPVEVIFAAGRTPLDLNNLFISDTDANGLIESAETSGVPRNYCAWIKGIKAIVDRDGPWDAVVGVCSGDCSNNFALIEMLQAYNIPTMDFLYPIRRDMDGMRREIERFAAALGTTVAEAESVRDRFTNIRALARAIDRETWETGRATGEENHLALISTTDMEGDPAAFEARLNGMLADIASRTPSEPDIRLAFAGIPPVFSDLYAFIESLGARVVYNEVQHQFSMPEETDSLAEQYIRYTYPYGMLARSEAIKQEVDRRRCGGVIHYVQSFCYHQMEDAVLRKVLDVPILRLEGDKPGPLDARTRLRIEAFIESLG